MELGAGTQHSGQGETEVSHKWRRVRGEAFLVCGDHITGGKGCMLP